jgi:hypothetical protein
MSIFVDPNALVTISLRYIELKNESDKVIGVKVLLEDSPHQENEKEIVCMARGRDYQTMSEILEECTLINHITGKPMIRSKVFRTMVMEKFFTTWNVLDDAGLMIPITLDKINNMYDQLVKRLVNKWLLKTNT